MTELLSLELPSCCQKLEKWWKCMKQWVLDYEQQTAKNFDPWENWVSSMIALIFSLEILSRLWCWEVNPSREDGSSWVREMKVEVKGSWGIWNSQGRVGEQRKLHRKIPPEVCVCYLESFAQYQAVHTLWKISWVWQGTMTENKPYYSQCLQWTKRVQFPTSQSWETLLNISDIQWGWQKSHILVLVLG